MRTCPQQIVSQMTITAMTELIHIDKYSLFFMLCNLISFIEPLKTVNCLQTLPCHYQRNLFIHAWTFFLQWISHALDLVQKPLCYKLIYYISLQLVEHKTYWKWIFGTYIKIKVKHLAKTKGKSPLVSFRSTREKTSWDLVFCLPSATTSWDQSKTISQSGQQCQ